MKTISTQPTVPPETQPDDADLLDSFSLLPGESVGAEPPEVLLRRVRTAFIRHPRVIRLMDSLDECLEEAQLSGQPYCMSLEGPSGAGKTTTLRKFAAQFSRTETPTGTRIPVLHVQVPSPATCKGLDGAILEALGDPAAHRGTLDAMVARIVLYLRRCEVQLLILDDIHNMLIVETDRQQAIVSNHLKDLIKRSGVTVLAVSVPDKIEELLAGNKELSRLFAVRETLSPFS
jgi:Cdc6-like AAA superfamily ATPase